MTTTIHVFEKAGLGVAPFRFVGVHVRKFQACPGAPVLPGGCCAYCSTGIMECCDILSADGKRFYVGNVCVYKTGDRGLIDPAKREIARLRREAGHKRDDDRIAAAREAIQDPAVRVVLGNHPHPMGWSDTSLLGWVLWMLDNAGRTGKVKAARAVERAVEDVGFKAEARE